VGGTPYYMAPEILKSGIDHLSPTKFKCDVYSFGILLNELLEETIPYKGNISEGTTTLKLQTLKEMIEKKQTTTLVLHKGSPPTPYHILLGQ